MVCPASSRPSSSPPLILASASPRRQQLLAQLALPFTVLPADIDEQLLPGEASQAYVLRMAQSKAQHVSRQYPTAVVLGADTVVVLAQEVLGKPRDAEDARQMLQRLSSRQHTVITGLAVLQQTRQLAHLDTVSTRVRFRSLTASDIAWYLATGEPFDKAGAYGIQGAGAAFVVSWEGCYNNVVGLPVQRTAALLRQVGLEIP